MRALVLILVAAWFATAHAQSATTGAIEGVVTDARTKEPVVGATVWATGATGEPQTALTDERGAYKITELYPGVYVVQFFVEEMTFVRKRIEVRPNQVTPVFQKVTFSEESRGEVFEFEGHPPQIDPSTYEKKVKFDRNAIEKIPNPGRDISGVVGATPGAHNDGLGVAIGGATSLENRYLVDGVDITGLTYGTQGTPVLSEFVEEAEVIAGGFSAEWGRAIGGIVNAVTKSGSNVLRGSVFGTLTPGLLTRKAIATPVNASSIDVTADRGYDLDFGAEVSGPVIKDHLFFFLGFAPQLSRTTYTRSTKRETDCRRLLDTGQLSDCDARLSSQGGYADGVPDIDPATGFYITDTIDTTERAATSQTYSALGKLSLAITPQHQAQLSLIAVPTRSERPGLYGLPTTGGRSSGFTTDAAVRWTSKLDSGKTEIEAIVAWHRSTANSGALDPSLDDQPRQILRDGSLGTWSALGGESARTAAGCADGTFGSSDPYPAITNCPMQSLSYATGGPGAITHDREDRRMARAVVTQRAKLLGSHEMKVGLDVERDAKQTARLYSGGAFLQNSIATGQVDVQRWIELGAADDPAFDQRCRTPQPGSSSGMGSAAEYACRYAGGSVGDPGTLIDGQTINWAAFVRDSWRPRTNVTLNVGVRYEEQRLRYADNLIGKIDALTGERTGTNAMKLDNNWAPRLGVIWDPTEEGASKIYASWGRFFEAIPMDINDRSFGGEVGYTQTFSTSAMTRPCGGMVDPRLGGVDGLGCLAPTGPATSETISGVNGVAVATDIKAQYQDEILAGVEYQLAPELRVGASFQHRALGRVIEDVSTDGAATYVIANPGEWSAQAEAALEARIAATTDAQVRARLENQRRLFRGIRTFDRPQRTYDAIELTVERRFAQGLMLRAAYTHARSFGNYPGAISYDNGQVDPNISSQYDLIELLSNRTGKLPQDRPHSIKVDGFYTFDLGARNALTLGGRLRVLSGIPQSALGAHYLYGPDESFLLPRGALGRGEYEHGIDVHLAYARKLSKTVAAELYVDIFNLYNKQGTFDTDHTYAPTARLSANGSGASENNVNPIVGGAYEDLIWAKSIDGQGNESGVPTARNPNFGRTSSRYAPTSARIGFRVTF